MRKWKDFDNDEIFALWKTYIATCCGGDVLRMSRYNHDRPLRLTYGEIHELVEELMNRLDLKEKE